jgi:hypothetical protein
LKMKPVSLVAIFFFKSIIKWLYFLGLRVIKMV